MVVDMVVDIVVVFVDMVVIPFCDTALFVIESCFVIVSCFVCNRAKLQFENLTIKLVRILQAYDGMGECRLFDGEWVRKPYGESSLAYTNKSCPTMPDWKNCFKYGRVDTDFLNWRWKPNDCELSRFDPCKFLRIVRGKRMGFIGDSISRNHLDSLICLLSKEEAPINIYNDSDDRFPAWHFPNHDFTLLALWSKFLVAEDELIVNGSNSGCLYCNEPYITNFNFTFAMRMSFRTALRYINECTECKPITTILRTLSPSHFENGLWNTGGNCNRTKPLREFEVGASEFNKEISKMQNEEIKGQKESV
ncbi:protein ALTERED XYLOGLUCAN 4 [Artemisia annua]|uniref:Protein ALTERED XYLOGLUCAN 4 n=1 Tax=Artemisia annua TaxID=35608 RepID=A0A2U1ML66_ARTAN|nr:protein ALTERED XYLOGLUCAN 4 [Artemisia annua]